MQRVNVTDLRPRLTELLARVEHGGDKVVVTRYGKSVAVLVSMEDFKRVWDAEEEHLLGPVNPETGRRRGGVLRMSDALRGRGWYWWR